MSTYRIRSGDTLSAIAARFHTTVGALARANHIANPNLIHTGELLQIPGASQPQDGFTPPPSTGGAKYTVRPGDTLSAIGARFGVGYQANARANGITNPNLIYVGQQLVIPGQTHGGHTNPTPPPTTGGATGIENRPGVKGNAEQTIEFFMSKGLTRQQAAGIAGNLLYESGFDPDSVGDGGTSFGIAQWHLGRGDAMKAWTRAHGFASNSFEGQLEFLWHELNSTESFALGKLKATGTAYDAGMAFQRYFERPLNINPARGQAAENFYRASLH